LEGIGKIKIPSSQWLEGIFEFLFSFKSSFHDCLILCNLSMFKKCGAGKVVLLATPGQRAPNLLRGAPQGEVNRPAHLQGKN
jgi:hypothetical protein